MNGYGKLDTLILARLKEISAGYLNDIMRDDVRAECERIATCTNREAFRVIDGRLQALRKRGAITFDRMFGWIAQ